MLHVGMDVHWKTTTICILDEHGQPVKRKEIRGDWQSVLNYVATIERPFQVVYEASCGCGFLYDRLSTMADRVVVGHPGRLRLICGSKRKSDRIDAKKLAMLLYVNMIPQAYVPSAKIRDWRELIEYRQRLVARRVRCKNTLRRPWPPPPAGGQRKTMRRCDEL
jgi:transposase